MLRFLMSASVVLVSLAVACEPPKAPELPTTGAVPAATAPTSPAPTSPTAAATAPETAPGKTPVPAGAHQAKEGEMCGGFAGIPCGKGLVCGNVMPVLDGSGTCRKGNP